MTLQTILKEQQNRRKDENYGDHAESNAFRHDKTVCKKGAEEAPPPAYQSISFAGRETTFLKPCQKKGRGGSAALCP